VQCSDVQAGGVCAAVPRNRNGVAVLPLLLILLLILLILVRQVAHSDRRASSLLLTAQGKLLQHNSTMLQLTVSNYTLNGSSTR
jgi:hypothetical protein